MPARSWGDKRNVLERAGSTRSIRRGYSPLLGRPQGAHVPFVSLQALRRPLLADGALSPASGHSAHRRDGVDADQWQGQVFTWVIVHQVLNPALRDDLPYALAMVE